MIERAEFSIPGLSERGAGDLEAALVGVSGIWSVTADSRRRTLTIEYLPNLTERAYLAQVIRQAGYPVESRPVIQLDEQRAEPPAEPGG